jgi:hypothetical protein
VIVTRRTGPPVSPQSGRPAADGDHPLLPGPLSGWRAPI